MSILYLRNFLQIGWRAAATILPQILVKRVLMRRLVLFTIILLLSFGPFRSVQAQGLSGAGECRTYTKEASEQALTELTRHQEAFIKFRTRQMAENVPPQLIDQTQTIISDYERAIDLTEQTLEGKLTQAEWGEGQESLQLLPPCDTANQTQMADGVSGQRLIGLVVVLLVVGGAILAVIYRKRVSKK